MQRILAVVLVLLGVCGLVLGRLGDTVWAPPTERTASVDLRDPGAAVVIDPGVLYIGGNEGEVRIEGASDVSVITAGNDDISAYIGDAKSTRITGLKDWETLQTKVEHEDGPTELPGVTASDLWRSVDTQKSPATIDIAAFRALETHEDPQPYRAILLVTDGKNPGASTVSITWPATDRNAWVPYAYAIGATLAVIGLILLVVSLGSGRRREDADGEVDGGLSADDAPDVDTEPDVKTEPIADQPSAPRHGRRRAAVPLDETQTETDIDPEETR